MPLNKMDILTPHIGLIFWQTIILLSAYLLLRKTAWAPILTFIKEEEQAYENAHKEREKAQRMSEQLERQHLLMIERTREKNDELLKRAHATKKALLEEATIEAARKKELMLAAGREQLQKERVQIFIEAKAQLVSLILPVASKFLQKKLQEEEEKTAFFQKLINEIPDRPIRSKSLP